MDDKVQGRRTVEDQAVPLQLHLLGKQVDDDEAEEVDEEAEDEVDDDDY